MSHAQLVSTATSFAPGYGLSQLQGSRVDGIISFAAAVQQRALPAPKSMPLPDGHGNSTSPHPLQRRTTSVGLVQRTMASPTNAFALVYSHHWAEWRSLIRRRGERGETGLCRRETRLSKGGPKSPGRRNASEIERGTLYRWWVLTSRMTYAAVYVGLVGHIILQ
jgi:hypothetical protein